MGASVPLNSAQQIPPSAAISAKVKGTRAYHRGFSKQIMKLNKYSASGRTQRNGITATSWHILFVTAINNTELHAGNSSQRSWVRGEGRGARVEDRGSAGFSLSSSDREKAGVRCSGLAASDFGPGTLDFGLPFQNFIAQTTQQTTYATSPQPHNPAWVRRVRCGSNKKG